MGTEMLLDLINPCTIVFPNTGDVQTSLVTKNENGGKLADGNIHRIQKRCEILNYAR